MKTGRPHPNPPFRLGSALGLHYLWFLKTIPMKALVNADYYRETFLDMPDGLEICFAEGKPLYSVKEMADHIQDFDILVISSLFPLSNVLLDKAGKLKLVCNLGAGFNNLDVRYARELGITVCNTPDAVTQSTAEITLSLMLGLMRRTAETNHRIRSEKEALWKYNLLTSRSLEGKTLGIVGMGKIGRRVAEMAAVFRMQVVYYNPHTEVPGYRRLPLGELLKTADIVSLHVPLNEHTRHLIGKEELALMKPKAVLVNTARGPVVDEQALVECLQQGRIAGAALDVYEHEPHVPEALYSMDNVVLTPHIGGNTEETLHSMMETAALNVKAFLQGSPLHVVN